MFTGNTTQTSITIASTGTFQTASAQNFSRKGVTLQYRGANTGYVFFGPVASATTAKSFALTQNQMLVLGVGSGLNLSDEINITATTADTFVLAVQA